MSRLSAQRRLPALGHPRTVSGRCCGNADFALTPCGRQRLVLSARHHGKLGQLLRTRCENAHSIVGASLMPLNCGYCPRCLEHKECDQAFAEDFRSTYLTTMWTTPIRGTSKHWPVTPAWDHRTLPAPGINQGPAVGVSERFCLNCQPIVSRCHLAVVAGSSLTAPKLNLSQLILLLARA